MLSAALGFALLFACVCVYCWTRNRASDKNQRDIALELYKRDVDND